MNFPSGIHTVLVTPFDDFHKIDYEDLQKWFVFQSNSDVVGLVLLGTTSESPTLSRIEQLDIVHKIHEWNSQLEKKKFITVGVGGNDTQENLEFALLCKDYCNAFMVTVPQYSKPTQNGIVEHYKHICQHSEISKKPIIMYNIPGRTSMNADPVTIKRIHETCPNVVAIKEASGSIDQLIKIRSTIPSLKVFSGDDKLLLDFMVHGGHGCISVASNAIPNVMTNLYVQCANGAFINATRIYYESTFIEFNELLFCETNPIPIKFILKQIGLYKTFNMRLPMTPLSEDKQNDILRFMHKKFSFE